MQDLRVLYIDFIITLASEEKKRSWLTTSSSFQVYFNQGPRACVRLASRLGERRRRRRRSRWRELTCLKKRKSVFCFLDDIADSARAKRIKMAARTGFWCSGLGRDSQQVGGCRAFLIRQPGESGAASEHFYPPRRLLESKTKHSRVEDGGLCYKYSSATPLKTNTTMLHRAR